MNPVILLDEVDKLGAGTGAAIPSSALLEVLDPAQNHTFRDHYLEVDLDLSDVLFIATANVADTIPGPLLDRMEVVRLDGYTEEEKVAIARDHLLPAPARAQRAARPTSVDVDDDALRTIVTDYTREAGVRNLERELGKLLRKVAARRSRPSRRPRPSRSDDGERRTRYLGRPRVLRRGGRRRAPRARRRHRARGHRRRRRRALRRGDRASDGEPGLHAHRPARRRHEGVGADRAVATCARTPTSSASTRDALEQRRFHVHVPAGAVPEGRAVGRRHDDDRARVACSPADRCAPTSA